MQSDDPAYLAVGTEVSAKFKGAFCEAKIKKVTKSLKIKVNLKEPPYGSVYVEDSALPKTAKLELNEYVDVLYNKATIRAVIQHIKDCSKYHVVFNDGDEKELRRTQLCLKGGKHFDAAVNLDALPLYNPEQFSSPVLKVSVGKSAKNSTKKRKVDESTPLKRKKQKEEDEESDEEDSGKKREKRAAASAASMSFAGMDVGDTQSEDSSADSSEEKEREKERRRRREEELERERKRVERENDKEKEKARKERERFKEKFEKVSREEPKEKPLRKIDEKLLAAGKIVVIFEDSAAAQKICDGIRTTKGNSESVSPPIGATPSTSTTSSISGSGALSTQSPKTSTPSSVYGVFYKKKWFPALVIPNSVYQSAKEQPKADDLAVRRFYDGKIVVRSKYQALPFSWIPSFSRKKLDEINENWGPGGSTRIHFNDALELAYTYVDTGKLPKGWSKELKDGSGAQSQKRETPRKSETGKTRKSEEKDDSNASSSNDEDMEEEDEDDDVEDSSDEEISSEERDLFIAKLYKFHEESASPINRVPHLGGKEIDLYHFYRIVQNYGGYKRVSANSRWCKILTKLKLKGCAGATSGTVKKAYARYLEPYSQFEAKLGFAFYGKDAQLSTGSSRSEQRRLLRAAQISELEKKKRRKSTTKDDGSKSLRGSKESSVVRENPTRDRKSGSPAAAISLDITTKKERMFSESGSLSSDGMSIKEEKLGVIEEENEPSTSNIDSVATTSREMKREMSQIKEFGPRMRDKRSVSLSTTDSGKRSKNEESPEENDLDGGKKKKHRKERKVTGQSIGSDGSGGIPVDVHDFDEGYQRPNVISHFYMGQKVRAIHCGRWYDARVVEIHQPKTLELVLLIGKGDDPNSITDRAKEELKQISEKMGVFVHYLGWNSRYDEWIDLKKLKIHEKDQQQSRVVIREHPNGRALSDYKIALSEMYTQGVENEADLEKILEAVREMPLKAAELTRRVETTPTRTSISPNTIQPAAFSGPSSMGRGMSLSSIMSQVGTGKDSNLTVRAVAAAAVGLEARARGSRILLSPPGSRTHKTLLHQVSSEEGMQALRTTDRLGGSLAMLASSGPLLPSMTQQLEPETPEKLTKEEKRKKVGVASRKVSEEDVPPKVEDDAEPKYRRTRSTSRNFEEPIKETASSPARTPRSSHSPKDSTADGVRKSARKLAAAAAATPRVFMSAQRNLGSGPLNLTPGKLATIKMQELNEKEKVVETPKSEVVEQKVEKIDQEEDDDDIPPLESADGVIDTPKRVDDAVASPAPAEPTPMQEETPVREKTPEVKEDEVTTTPVTTKEETPITPIETIKRVPTTIGSNRGSSSKRKRGRYSQMVVDRKYQKVGNSANRKHHSEEDGDEGEDEDGFGTPFARSDTFHTLKMRMYRLMEQEGSLHDLTPLGLPDYADLLRTTSDDQLDDVLENRAWDLRDIYAQAKSEIVAMGKAKRRFNERKREKERQQARRSATPRDSIQRVPRGGSVDRGGVANRSTVTPTRVSPMEV